MKHYVYRIINTKLNKHYYGTRTSKNRIPEEDIGVFYFSSSRDKEFVKDQKENPQDYKYKIIKKFNTRKEAIELEIKLHDKFNVGVNESFYNRSKQTSTRFDIQGIKLSEQTKQNMSIAKKNMTQETKNKISKAKMGIKRKQKDIIKMTENRKGKGKGKNNSMTKRVEIYDSANNLVMVSEGNFKLFCEENSLPYISFIKNFNKKIYQSKIGPHYAKKNGFEEYIGWTAKV